MRRWTLQLATLYCHENCLSQLRQIAEAHPWELVAGAHGIVRPLPGCSGLGRGVEWEQSQDGCRNYVLGN